MLLKTMIKTHRSKDIKGRCDLCWTGYVDSCICGGLIHNEYDILLEVDDVVLNYECDKCIDQWEFKR